MPNRTYSEAEIRALIERAAELQSQAEASPGPGLTLSELEEVAGASGIDPQFLRTAAAEHQAGAALALKREHSDATHIYVERVLPGEFEMERWEDVVAELRHRFDSAAGAMWGMPNYGEGTAEQIGRTVSWKHTSVSGIETRVLARPRDGQTHLQVSQRVGLGSTVTESVMYGAIAGLVLGAAPGAILIQAGWGIVLGFVLMTLIAIPVVYKLDLAWRAKKHRELKELADALGRMLAAPASGPVPAGSAVAGSNGTAEPAERAPESLPSRSGADRLDLDGLDATEPDAERAPSTRVRA